MLCVLYFEKKKKILNNQQALKTASIRSNSNSNKTSSNNTLNLTRIRAKLNNSSSTGANANIQQQQLQQQQPQQYSDASGNFRYSYQSSVDAMSGSGTHSFQKNFYPGDPNRQISRLVFKLDHFLKELS